MELGVRSVRKTMNKAHPHQTIHALAAKLDIPITLQEALTFNIPQALRFIPI